MPPVARFRHCGIGSARRSGRVFDEEVGILDTAAAATSQRTLVDSSAFRCSSARLVLSRLEIDQRKSRRRSACEHPRCRRMPIRDQQPGVISEYEICDANLIPTEITSAHARNLRVSVADWDTTKEGEAAQRAGRARA